MAYGFNPASLFMPEEPALPQFLTPEEMQQQAITERFNASRGGGFVPAMMGALDYMRTAMPAQAPTPRTVSGGSVIGLMPEQTNALLNRVNEANMLDQRMFEARQGEMRADSRAREGRILSAREAQARRQQELAIEKQKADMDMRKEAEERARVTIDALPGMPGFGVRKGQGPDGNPVTEIVQLPGAEALPTDPTRTPSDYTINNTRYSGATNQPLVTAPETTSAAQTEVNRRFYLEWLDKHGMVDDTGKVVPLGAKEKLGMAAHLTANPNDFELELFKAMVPLEKKQNQREFTWYDIGAEMGRRRNAMASFGLIDEEKIKTETADFFGLTVDELNSIMNQKAAVPPTATPTLPPVPAGTQNFGPPAPQTGFDDEESIPEGAQVQDEKGRMLVKKNGKLVPVTGF